MAKRVEVKAHIVPQYGGEIASYYSNYFRFRQSQHECLLEFGRVCPPLIEEEDDVPEVLELKAMMQGEIWLTKEVAQQLRDLLGRQLADEGQANDEGTEE